MSTIWTPGGEKPVGSPQEASTQPASDTSTADPTGTSGNAGAESMQQLSPEEQARLQELRDQLAQTPAEVVVANHCFGLFELAALHLSLDPPQLDQAKLAIDAFAALVNELGDRLGEQQLHLKEALSQLQLAFVRIGQANGQEPDSASTGSAE